MTRQEFEHVISFCILMGSKESLLSKAPTYVMEKFEHSDAGSLDESNLRLFHSYVKLWGSHLAFFDDK